MDKVKGAITKLWANLLRQRLAYRDCFCDKAGNFTTAGEFALKDLAKYCYVNKSSVQSSLITGTIDPYITAYNEGKRAVYNRIIKLCKLKDEQLTKLMEDSNVE